MGNDMDSTASSHGLSPIGSADVGKKAIELIGDMLGAIDCGTIDSEEIPADESNGVPPYKFHQEWAYHARRLLASLHREAIAEKPCFEGVTTTGLEPDPNSASGYRISPTPRIMGGEGG